MRYPFPSEEWVEAYKDVINSDAAYKKAGADWDKGVVALVCQKKPSLGIDEDVGIWLDLHKGVCREARRVDLTAARTAPFCIIGKYERWKQVMQGRLDPIKGIMQGKFRLYGDLAEVVKYVEASKALVACSAAVPTDYLDE